MPDHGIGRRDALAAAAAIGAAVLGLGRVAAAQTPGASEVERGTTRVRGFASGEVDFQLMRSLGAANYGGGTAGEIFAARAAIGDRDIDAWPAVFSDMGARIASLGEAALAAGHKVSARDHFMRASMYLRAAEYFSDPLGPIGSAYGLGSRGAFIKAAPLLSDRVEAIEVPFEGMKLPGYFMTPSGGARRGRTIVILTGFDGTGEELYFEAAKAGLDRGYNVFIAEGPGQAGTLRFHPDSKFMPNYEKPIAAMLDAALARPEVAAERLALYGISFGGYFVTRAGEHDRRIKALIANSPIIDLLAYFGGFLGPGAASGNPPPLKLSEVDSIPDAQFPKVMKLGFKAACRRFGADSFAALVTRLTYFNAERELGEIRCPTLALVGSGEGRQALAQWERFAAKVSGPATKRLFTTDEGAEMHCQLGNLPLSNAVIFDWLDDLFDA